jgi:hypothetical protein
MAGTWFLAVLACRPAENTPIGSLQTTRRGILGPGDRAGQDQAGERRAQRFGGSGAAHIDRYAPLAWKGPSARSDEGFTRRRQSGEAEKEIRLPPLPLAHTPQ